VLTGEAQLVRAIRYNRNMVSVVAIGNDHDEWYCAHEQGRFAAAALEVLLAQVPRPVVVIGRKLQDALKSHGDISYIDLDELLYVFFPNLAGKDIQEVAHAFDRPYSNLMSPAKLIAEIGQVAFARAQKLAASLPPDELSYIAEYSRRLGWSLAPFWDFVSQRRGHAYYTDVAEPLSLQPSQAEARRYNPEVRLIDVKKVKGYIEPGGKLAEVLPGYEARPEQAEMLERVANAFNENQRLLIEAGTGTGKSLAYLLPSAMWSINSERVVISTHTTTLQKQLEERDIPIVKRVVDLPFNVALLKGKGRYLCDKSLARMKQVWPRDVEEARFLARILLWRSQTKTGEVDEIALDTAKERGMFKQISAENMFCSMQRCRNANCYFYKAYERAMSAHLLIVNHALLAADIVSGHHVLPGYRRVIIDEAHHFEQAAIEAFSKILTKDDLAEVMPKVRTRDAHELFPMLNSLAMYYPELAELTDKLGEATERCLASYKQFFEVLNKFFLGVRPNKIKDDDTARVVINEDVENDFYKNNVKRAAHEVMSALSTWRNVTEGVLSGLEKIKESNETAEDIIDYIKNLTREIGKFKMVFEFVTFGSTNDVLWIEEFRDARIALCSAPLWIGKKLAEFWQSQSTAILTSATLQGVQSTTQQGFSYIINQLGLRRAAPFTAVIPSPFNYKEAALVYVVEDMPSVKDPEYRNKLAEGLIALFSASEGRGLALFNSYRAMRDAHERIAPKLIAEPYQIRVLKQGDGLSRTEMLALLKEREKTALLGARTFWEGIDVPGANLVALAICHLPFDPPDDPILIARERAGKDKNVFFNYSLPRSILLFKQGFGRLIRTKQDYGVVVVFDSRIVNERYGVHFLRALPNPRVVSGSLEGIYDAVSEWLSRHELGQSRDAIYNSLF